MLVSTARTFRRPLHRQPAMHLVDRNPRTLIAEIGNTSLRRIITEVKAGKNVGVNGAHVSPPSSSPARHASCRPQSADPYSRDRQHVPASHHHGGKSGQECWCQRRARFAALFIASPPCILSTAIRGPL